MICIGNFNEHLWSDCFLVSWGVKLPYFTVGFKLFPGCLQAESRQTQGLLDLKQLSYEKAIIIFWPFKKTLL